jgi:hypothetical protein
MTLKRKAWLSLETQAFLVSQNNSAALEDRQEKDEDKDGRQGALLAFECR